MRPKAAVGSCVRPTFICECLCVHCSQLEHDAWLARERVAQAEFQKKREREETILWEREEREVCVCV